MINLAVDLLQKHREVIVEEACNEIILKIPEYQNYPIEKVTQIYHLGIESIQKGLEKEDSASLYSFVNEINCLQDQNNFKFSRTIESVNIFKKTIIKKLFTDNHTNLNLLIPAIEKINSIQDKSILLMSDNYQNRVEQILKNRDKEVSLKISKATSDLEKLEQFSEYILQSMTSGLLIVDNQKYIIRKFNKAMESITGFPASAVLGKSLEDVFSYVEGIPFDYFYNEIKRSGKVERTKLKLKRNSGKDVYRFIKADVLYDNDENSIGIMIIIDDVTENEVIKESFSRYVAHQVVERILNGAEKVCLSGVRKEVTVLFADVRGFTSLSENCEPEKVVSMLNKFFSLMVDVIFKYEGTLDKFIGDNIMAVFGAPVSQPDDTHRAVLAAYEMQEKIKTFNDNNDSKNEKSLEIGIGINTGEAVAGNIGSEKRMDYTVIGDAVNFADRIQSQSKGGEILISDSTYRKVKDKITVETLIPRYVKGKEKEVVLYKVIGVI